MSDQTEIKTNGYFNTLDSLDPLSPNNPFYGEKYKDKASRDTGDYRHARGAGVSVSIFALAATGKYSFEEIMDPTKLVAEKHAMFDRVFNALKSEPNDPESKKWIAEQIYNGRIATNRMINEEGRKIDYKQEHILEDRRFDMLLHMGRAQHGCWVESENCDAEVFELASKDNKSLTDWLSYREMWTQETVPFADCLDAFRIMHRNVKDLETENYGFASSPLAGVLSCRMAVDSLLKEFDQNLSFGNGAEMSKWVSDASMQEFRELYRSMGQDILKAEIRFLENDPKTVNDLLNAALDGKLTTKASYNRGHITGLPGEDEMRQIAEAEAKSTLSSRDKLAQYFEGDGHSSAPKAADEGKVYAWDAFDGRMDLGSKIQKFPDNAKSAWMLTHGTPDLASKKDAIYSKHLSDEYEEKVAETLEEKVVDATKGGGKLYIAADSVASPLPEGYEDRAKQLLSDIESAMCGAADEYRKFKSDDPDPEKASFIEHGFERFAKWSEDFGKMAGFDSGNYLLGISRNATLNMMLSRYAEMPIIDCTIPEKDFNPDPELAKKQVRDNIKENMTRTIRVMGQLDQPKDSRVSIFDDYMDIMDGVNSEFSLEYERQSFEKSLGGGWSSEYEDIYRNKLRTSHEKIISAYDRLLSVDDHGQYDKVIGDKLVNVTGKNGPDRDLASTIGYMRGEVRAVDLGYPSDQLFVLGYLGDIEESIDLRIRGCDHVIKVRPEYADQYTKEKNSLEDLRRELDSMKSEVWDKEYSGPEAALESWHKTKAFLDEHPNLTGHIEQFDYFVKQNATGLAERTKEVKELNAAMEQFNVKRTDYWLSSESKEHKGLRLSAEKLQKDLMAYKSGIYQEGEKKGRAMSEKEREALKEGLEKRAAEVAEKADIYLDARKKDRSTEAGRSRKAGAEQIRNFASNLKESLKAQREMEQGIISEKAVDQAKEMAADIDAALERTVDHTYTTAERVDGPRRLHGFEFVRATDYDELKKAGELENDDFVKHLAGVIVGKTIDMKFRKDPDSIYMGTEALEKSKLDMYREGIRALEKDPSFNRWSQQFTSKDPNCAANREEISSMSPGEIFTKFTLARQNEMLRAETAGKRDMTKQAQMQQKAPTPKAPGM